MREARNQLAVRIDYGLDGDRRIQHCYVTESAGIAVGFLLAALHWSGLATLTRTFPPAIPPPMPPSPSSARRHSMK